MSYYENDAVTKYKKAIRNTFIGLGILLLISVGLNIGLCLLMESINHVLIQLLNTCITAACAFAIIYKTDTVVCDSVKKLKHYKAIEGAPKKEFCGTVQKIGEIITVSVGLRSREICLVENKKIYSFYLLENFEYDFKVGDVVKLTVAKNHITRSLVIERSEKEVYA